MNKYNEDDAAVYKYIYVHSNTFNAVLNGITIQETPL